MKNFEIVSVTRSVTMFTTEITVFTVCHSLSESVTLNITKVEQSFFTVAVTSLFLCIQLTVSMHSTLGSFDPLLSGIYSFE